MISSWVSTEYVAQYSLETIEMEREREKENEEICRLASIIPLRKRDRNGRMRENTGWNRENDTQSSLPAKLSFVTRIRPISRGVKVFYGFKERRFVHLNTAELTRPRSTGNTFDARCTWIKHHSERQPMHEWRARLKKKKEEKKKKKKRRRRTRNVWETILCSRSRGISRAITGRDSAERDRKRLNYSVNAISSEM